MFLQIPYALSPFFWLFSEPSNISVSVGSCGRQNWVCLTCVIASVLDADLMKYVRGQRKGVFQQLPRGPTVLLREAGQPQLHCSYSFFLGLQSILFSTFNIFLHILRSTTAPSSQHWEFNDLPQPQMFFDVTKSRITSLRMVFIL